MKNYCSFKPLLANVNLYRYIPGFPAPEVTLTPRDAPAPAAPGAKKAKKEKGKGGAAGKLITGAQDAMGETSSGPDVNGPRATLIVCPLSGRVGYHFSPRYFALCTLHHVILQSNHGSIDDSQYGCPCNQSDTPRE
jgi:hypothetical protein